VKPERVAACPLIERRGRLHVVLVTGRRHGAWLLPKGRLEADLSHREVAELEAWEEAGVVGSASGRPSQFRVPGPAGGRRRMLAYVVHVRRLARLWPERGQRIRRLVPIDAIHRLDLDPAWRRCIERLVSRG
jgi:8-oxo-dGTP pyrophosphatase MutT (NUDIX family)